MKGKIKYLETIYKKPSQPRWPEGRMESWIQVIEQKPEKLVAMEWAKKRWPGGTLLLTTFYTVLPRAWQPAGFSKGVDLFQLWDSSPAANTEPDPSVPISHFLLWHFNNSNGKLLGTSFWSMMSRVIKLNKATCILCFIWKGCKVWRFAFS